MRRPLFMRRFFRALSASPSSSTRVASRPSLMLSADLFEGTLPKGTTQDEDLSSNAQGVRRDYSVTRSCDDATEEMDGAATGSSPQSRLRDGSARCRPSCLVHLSQRPHSTSGVPEIENHDGAVSGTDPVKAWKCSSLGALPRERHATSGLSESPWYPLPALLKELGAHHFGGAEVGVCLGAFVAHPAAGDAVPVEVRPELRHVLGLAAFALPHSSCRPYPFTARTPWVTLPTRLSVDLQNVTDAAQGSTSVSAS